MSSENPTNCIPFRVKIKSTGKCIILADSDLTLQVVYKTLLLVCKLWKNDETALFHRLQNAGKQWGTSKLLVTSKLWVRG